MAKDNNWRLIGSDSTIEQLNKGINEYFYGSEKELIKINDTLWNVKGTKGIHEHLRVIKSGKRYRFEHYYSK